VLHVCRVSWAGLELRCGNLDVCRQLLREGLDQHPDYPAALLLTAQLERRSGNLNLAEAYARRAQKVGELVCVIPLGGALNPAQAYAWRAHQFVWWGCASRGGEGRYGLHGRCRVWVSSKAGHGDWFVVCRQPSGCPYEPGLAPYRAIRQGSDPVK
jgi:hypothetical protein